MTVREPKIAYNLISLTISELKNLISISLIRTQSFRGVV